MKKVNFAKFVKRSLTVVMLASIIIFGAVASLSAGYLIAPMFKTLHIPAERRTEIIKRIDLDAGAVYVANGDYVYTDSRDLESELTYFASPYGINSDTIECRLPDTSYIRITFTTDSLDPRILNEDSYYRTLNNYDKVRDTFPIVFSLSLLFGVLIATMSFWGIKTASNYLQMAHVVYRCAQETSVSRGLKKYLSSCLEAYRLDLIHKLFVKIDRFSIVFLFACTGAFALLTGLYTYLSAVLSLYSAMGVIILIVHPLVSRFGEALVRRHNHFKRAVVSLFYDLSIPERRLLLINHLDIDN